MTLNLSRHLPATFGTSKGTSITIKISVVEPKYVEDNKHNIGITAFDFYKNAG